MIRPVTLALVALITATGLARADVDIQEVTSPGGITAWLVEERSIPFVALEIRFKGGASLDAPGKRGATNLMTATLEEGAGDLDSQGFAAAADALAAQISFDVDDDALSISARFLTENRDEGVALLKSALTETRFSPEAVERVRGQILSIIQSDTKDPETIASDAFMSLAFPDHPYASSINGTGETLAGLTSEDMFEARDRVIARDRLFVGVVGDISAAELGVLLDELLGDLPETGADLPDRVDFALEGGETVIPFENPQSVIIFGQPGLTRHDPDFFPAFMLVHVLGGGGFNSRLMQEVRQKRGLTYGIGAYLVPKDYGETLIGQVSTVNARVPDTIGVVKDEWRRLATEGLSAEELDRVKTFLTGAYPLRFDGNGRIARILVGMQMDDLPLDYIVTRNDKVRAVTLEEINAVAADLIQPDGLHFVVVGQPEGLVETSN